MMSDHDWQVMSAKIPRPHRLPVGLLSPDVRHVYACGAYYAWGRHSDAPWSRYLRLGKGWAADEDERSAVFSLAGAYIARYIAAETSILEHAAVVVPVPANPDRFAARMASLPDELAASVRERLCVPAYLRAVAWEPDQSSVEMKKLGRRERAQVAPHLFRPGPQAGKVRGLCVLLVDDLITSGSTMRACARVLLAQGATSVLGAALAHTEG